MILAITNQKGGVGKTTTTLNIGVYLATKGKKILIVDIDPQSNASTFLLPSYAEQFEGENSENLTLYSTIIERKPLNIYKSKYENIDIAPSSLLLSTADIALAVVSNNRETRLKNELDKIKHAYDYILIDCPPALNTLALNAYRASDKFAIVIDTGLDSLSGIPQLSITINSIVKERLKHNIELAGIILNKFKNPKKDLPTREILKQLDESELTKYLFTSKLPYRNIIENSKAKGKTPFDFGENQYTIALSYLCKQLFNI